MFSSEHRLAHLARKQGPCARYRGLVASLAAQATLTALDTPDTRSWETLPARIAVARVRLPAGRHRVVVDARGWARSQEIAVEKGSWQVVSLMALR